ncbi:hypothetical protein JCM16814_07480 [Desulfobaculum senezii]|jgi:hypothetical protein
MWASLSRGMQIIIITGLFSVVAFGIGALIVWRHNRAKGDGDDADR